MKVPYAPYLTAPYAIAYVNAIVRPHCDFQHVSAWSVKIKQIYLKIVILKSKSTQTSKTENLQFIAMVSSPSLKLWAPLPLFLRNGSLVCRVYKKLILSDSIFVVIALPVLVEYCKPRHQYLLHKAHCNCEATNGDRRGGVCPVSWNFSTEPRTSFLTSVSSFMFQREAFPGYQSCCRRIHEWLCKRTRWSVKREDSQLPLRLREWFHCFYDLGDDFPTLYMGCAFVFL